MIPGPLAPVRVRVTARDIAAGCATSPGRCPVARAVLRLLSPGWRVSVGSMSVDFYSPAEGLADVVCLPSVAVRFIKAFDGGGPAAPFRFRFAVPVAARRVRGVQS